MTSNLNFEQILIRNPGSLWLSGDARNRGLSDGEALRRAQARVRGLELPGPHARRRGPRFRAVGQTLEGSFSAASNIMGLVLGCIKADVCIEKLILQHFSRSTRFPHVCAAAESSIWHVNVLCCFG